MYFFNEMGRHHSQKPNQFHALHQNNCKINTAKLSFFFIPHILFPYQNLASTLSATQSDEVVLETTHSNK